MRIEDIHVSQLEKALQDPNVMSALRNFSPELAAMTDQEFLQCSNGVMNRLKQFQEKYGDMTGNDIMAMNKKEVNHDGKNQHRARCRYI